MKQFAIFLDTLGEWDMNGLMIYTNTIEAERLDAVRIQAITSKDHTKSGQYHLIVKAVDSASVNAWLVRTKLFKENPEIV